MITGVDECVWAYEADWWVETDGLAEADWVGVDDELIEEDEEIVVVIDRAPVLDLGAENVIDGEDESDCAGLCVWVITGVDVCVWA